MVLCPHVLGPADAGMAWLMAKARATARTILDDMVILLSVFESP